jgi:hypothetical protein
MKKWSWLVLVLNVVDAMLTTYVILTGIGEELNPIMKSVIDFNIGFFIFIKTVIGSLPLIYLHTSDRITLGFCTVVRSLAILYIVVVSWNLLNIGVYFLS